MEKHHRSPIKEVVARFPEVGKILEEYHVGCVSCSVGSCLLRDVVAIHNLSEEQESALMYGVEKAIYPHRDVQKPTLKKNKKSKKPREIKYSPPIKKLVEEHLLIKRWIALVPAITAVVDVHLESDRQWILNGVDFIRSYADKFHHAKEEDILFKYLDESLDIVQTMLQDHEEGRSHVRAVVAGLEKKDREAVVTHLKGYAQLLTEHIKKEDEILYPWIDRGLSITQVGELFDKFNEVDAKMGVCVTEKYRQFVERAEGNFKK